MSDLNNEIGNITSAIEHLENSLKKRTSFMHSTPKISTYAHESDSGVETALQTNPLRSDEAGRTVIFGARSKVTSENGISTNSETLVTRKVISVSLRVQICHLVILEIRIWVF